MRLVLRIEDQVVDYYITDIKPNENPFEVMKQDILSTFKYDKLNVLYYNDKGEEVIIPFKDATEEMIAGLSYSGVDDGIFLNDNQDDLFEITTDGCRISVWDPEITTYDWRIIK